LILQADHSDNGGIGEDWAGFVQTLKTFIRTQNSLVINKFARVYEAIKNEIEATKKEILSETEANKKEIEAKIDATNKTIDASEKKVLAEIKKEAQANQDILKAFMEEMRSELKKE